MSTGEGVEFPLNIPGLVMISGDNQDAAEAESNGCLSGDTLIDCPRDLTVYPQGIPIKELVGTTPMVYCWKNGTIAIDRASSVHMSKRAAAVVRVKVSKYRTNKGAGLGRKYLPPQELVGTPDHLVLLSDGITWKELGSLVPGDSLCSMYRRESGGWRTLIYWTGIPQTKAVSEQQFVCTAANGPKPCDGKEYHAHHRDENDFNHSTDNMEWLEKTEHLSAHATNRNKEGNLGWHNTSGVHPRGALGLKHTAESKANISSTLRRTAERKRLGLPSSKVNHTVLSVEPAGYEDVYDITVPGAANFIANGIVVHNSGKSVSISGVLYALYGKVPFPPDHTIEADDVVHEKVGKDCSVVLLFEDDDGSTVKVTRTRKDTTKEKPNDLLLEVNGVSISGSTNELTQAKLDTIIGIDYDTFCALMPGLGQEMASMTDASIKEFIEGLLKTSELGIAHDLAKAKVKELKETQTTLDKDIAVLAVQKSNALLSVVNAEKFGAEFAALHAVNLATAASSLLDAEGRLLSATKKVTDKRTELEKAHNPTAFKVASDKAQDLSTKLETINTKQTELAANFARKKATLASEKKALTATIEKFKELDECPVCLSCVEENHKDKIIADHKEQIVANNAALEQLNKDRDALAAKYAEIKKKWTTALDALQPQLELQKQAETTVKRLRAELFNLEKEELAAQKAKTACEEHAKDVQDTTNDWHVKAKESKDLAETLEQDIQTKTQELIAAREELALTKYWVDAFSPSGIRSHMLEKVIPYLNDRAAYYCDRISKGEMTVKFNTKTSQKTGKVVDKFKIEVSNAHGCSRWKGSSKGERARASLVIALVLGDLASLNTSKKLSFRVIDELLDPIDKSGDAAIIELLSSMEAEFGSIYVITHKSSLKSKFTKEIVMRKKNSFTSVKGIFEREAE